MKKSRQSTVLGIAVVFAVIFCFPELSLAAVEITWGESNAARAVKDENGDLLIGNHNEAADSDCVQLIYAGADGLADIPTWNGGVTGDDEILAASYIGHARAPILSDEGLWSMAGPIIDAYAVGSKFYVRAWNAPDSSQWTHYGDCPDLYTVTIEQLQTYGNAGNFSTTNYVGPCTPAVAEISPIVVEINIQDQAFSYHIEPTIGAINSGIDEIAITVPVGYSDVTVTAALVGGRPAAYTDNSIGNTISVTLDSVANTDGANIQVNFTADTPTAADSGTNFTSTVANASNLETVSCTSGDGDGGGSVTTNTWTVTAGNGTTPTLTIDSVSSAGGDIPLQVTFEVTGNSEPGDNNLDYYFDYDGNGNFDEHVTEADETQITTTYLYTVVGIYTVKIKAVDSGSSLTVENTSTVITTTQASTLQAWLIQPRDGDTLGGTAVTLHAGATPQNQIKRVKFQYNDGAWQDIGTWITPPLLRTTWDVSGLADGGYDLRAVAENTSGGTVNSDSVTITVDNSDPDNTEGPGNSGNHSKRKTISKDKTEVVSVYDGTEIEVLYGTLAADSVVEIKLTGTSSNAANGAAAGKTDIAATREFSIDGVTVPLQAITIKIPYPDTDDDGKIDGTNVNETTLKVYWYDETLGEWALAVSSEVNATENYVTASVIHLSEFGLFGDSVSSGGGGGCFLSTTQP